MISYKANRMPVEKQSPKIKKRLSAKYVEEHIKIQ